MAIMGTGVATGVDRARLAATAAISSPLLEDASVNGARGVIINVTGGPDLTLTEVSEASDIIHTAAHEEANIIFGAVIDPKMSGKVKITVIATGFDHAIVSASPLAQSARPTPVDLSAFVTHRGGEEERLVPSGGRLSVTRRPVIELPALSPRSSYAAAVGSDDGLDVPAFLRRKDV